MTFRGILLLTLSYLQEAENMQWGTSGSAAVVLSILFFDETDTWKWGPRVGFGNLSSDQPTVQGQCDWLGMGRSVIQHKPGVSQVYNCAMFTDIYKCTWGFTPELDSHCRHISYTGMSPCTLTWQ